MKKSKLLIVATSALLAFTAFASGCKQETVEYGDWVITNYPTATASGTAKRVSTDGTKTEEISIPSVSDTDFWKKVSETAPTHTAAGEAEYECVYGKATLELKPLGHDYKGVTARVTVVPTATEEGKAVFVCNDGDGQDEIILPAINGTDYAIKAAGHTTAGTATYKSQFGDVVIELEPTGHVFGEKKFEIIQAPTLTEKGTAWEYCNSYASEKGENVGKREVEVPALSDETVWKEETEKAVAPTHSAAGKKVYSSAKYGKVEVVVEALGHDYESEHEIVVTKQPTLTEAGAAIEYCADYANEEEGAKGSREIVVPVLTDESVWTKTVTEYHEKEGVAVYSSKYGRVEITIPAAGHDYESEHRIEMTVAPTLKSTGLAIEYCADYDTETQKGKREVVVPSLSDEDKWTITSVAPTHTEPGAYVYTSKYGEVRIPLKATGHNYIKEHLIEITVAPTLTESGKAIEYCADYETETEKGSQEITIPELSQTRVWTKVTLPPDYFHGTRDVYTSKYGEVVIEHDDRVLLPFQDKYYKSVMLNAYSSNAFGSEYARGQVTFDDTWQDNTPFYLGEDGTGIGSAHPFTVGTKYTFYDYDVETGRIMVKALPQSSRTTTDEDGNVTTEHYYDESTAVVSVAYIDFATGIMIKPAHKDYNYSVIATPYANGIDADKSKASAWDKAIALTVVYDDGEEKTLNAFIYNGAVYFGATFTDIEGNAIAAEDCYGAAQVYVKDALGNAVAAFGWNGEDMVELDGNEGKYTLDGAEIIVSGTGLIVKGGEVVAKYALIEGNKLGVTAIDGSKYEIYTLDKSNMTAASEMPRVTVEYDLGGVTVTDASVFAGFAKTARGYKTDAFNQNTALTAVVPEANGKVFLGWKTADGSTFTNGTIITENVVLVADWRAEIVLFYTNADGEKIEIKAAEGVRIGEYLPTPDDRFDAETLKYYQFAGWNLDGVDIPLDTPVASGAAGKTLNITWKELNAYVGTYNGTEIWNAGYGNSSSKTLTITEDGKISGLKTGTILSYDPVSGKITWKDNYNREYCFWFDVKSGVIAGLYNNTKIGNDLYIFGNAEYQTTGKMAATYGVWDPETEGYEAQFIRINTRNGLADVFTYKNHIYSNVSITDAAGNKLEISEIKKSKTVVVTDLDSGEVIVKLATTTDSFEKGNSNKTNKQLDDWAGSYAFGEQTVVLDGTGIIVYGEKTGEYTKAEGKDYDFDVYFGEGTEYMRLTLSGTECTIVKPMATFTFDVGGKTVSAGDAEKIAEKQVNLMIAVELPALGNIEGFVFRGWYSDPLFVNKASETIVPTGDVTVYALWQEKCTVSVVIGGEGNYTQEYAKGETAAVEKPVVKGYKFLGWYTTPDYEKGTEWTDGSAVTENVVIYAKWTDAPAYNNTYVATEIENKDAESGLGSIYSWTSAIITIDPDGYATSTAYPFRGEVTVAQGATYAEDGAITLTVAAPNGSVDVRYGYIDKKTGIAVITYTSNEKASYGEVFFLNPFETKSLTSGSMLTSYWLNGAARAIEYKYDGKTYSAFVKGDKVYFNVSFKNAEGATVKANGAYAEETVIVTDESGKIIAKYCNDGENLQLMDGYEGEYKLDGEQSASVVLNGVNIITLNGVKGTYVLGGGKGYNVEAYVDGSYYRLNVNKQNATYTITKPMANISYSLGDVAIESAIAVHETRNYNIEYELPAPTSKTHILRGWYLSGDADTLYTKYSPDRDVMFYAKWDKKVVLTVVYGNGLPTVKLSYGAGDVTEPEQPGYANGKTFAGWFTDEACTQAYVPGVINANTTIYCKWIEAVAYAGNYVGYNIWGTSGNGSFSSSSQKITVDPSGAVSGKINGSIVKNADGSYKLASGLPLLIDEKNGVIVTPYSGSASSMGNDWYVYVKGVQSYTCNKSNDQYVWNSGSTKLTLVTLTYADGTKKEMVIFVHGGKVYGNVTWSCTGISQIGKLTTSALANLVVTDSDGAVVYGA